MRPLAERGSAAKVRIEVRGAYSSAVAPTGAAECAATQMAQMLSVPLEWWCETRATADQKVASRHSAATYLANERNPYLGTQIPSIYTCPKLRCNRTFVTPCLL
jgi:hypothetical protein